MSAPAFAFCFPLLRCVLREGGKAVKGDEDLRQEVLQVVAEHCKLRAIDDEDEEQGQKEVNELSRVQMKNLFVFLIGRFVSSDMLRSRIASHSQVASN